MFKARAGTGAEYCAGGCMRGLWRAALTVLTFSLLLPTASVFGVTIDFEQFAFAPSDCGANSPENLNLGIVGFSDGQAANGVAGAYDQTTVYWTSSACSLSNDNLSSIGISFAVPVSNVQLLLENLDVENPLTHYEICDNLGDCDEQWLPAPGTVANPASTSTVVTLPYSGITNIFVAHFGPGPWNFLIDNVTFSVQFPLPDFRIHALLRVWNRLGCATSTARACTAINAALRRWGAPPPSCGGPGELCCVSPGTAPCDAGSCDPASNTCP